MTPVIECLRMASGREMSRLLCMHGWDWGTRERMSLESSRFGIWLRVEVWGLV